MSLNTLTAGSPGTRPPLGAAQSKTFQRAVHLKVNGREYQTTAGMLPILAWGLRHAGDLPKVQADITAIISAPDLPSKYAAGQDLVTLLYNDLSDFPGFSTPAPTPAPNPTPSPSPAPGPIGPIEVYYDPVSAFHDELHDAVRAIGDGNLLHEALTFLTSADFIRVISMIASIAEALA